MPSEQGHVPIAQRRLRNVEKKVKGFICQPAELLFTVVVIVLCVSVCVCLCVFHSNFVTILKAIPVQQRLKVFVGFAFHSTRILIHILIFPFVGEF